MKEGVVLALKIALAGIGFVLSIVLVQKLGAREGGAFLYFLSSVVLLSQFFKCGLDQVLAALYANNVMSKTDTVGAYHQVLKNSTFFSLVGLIPLLPVYGVTNGLVVYISSIAMAITALTSEAIKGRGYSGLSAGLLLAQPILFLLAILLNLDLYPSFLLSLFVGVTTGLIVFHKIPHNLTKEKIEYGNDIHLKKGLPLMFSSLMGALFLFIPVHFLSVYEQEEMVAFFSIAQKMAIFGSFGLFAMNAVYYRDLSPRNCKSNVEIASRRISVMSTLFCAFVLILIGGLGHYFDSYIPRISIYIALTIGIGQLVSCFCGPCGVLLVLNGMKKWLIVSGVVSTSFLLLSLMLFTSEGVYVVAVCVSLAYVVQNMFNVTIIMNLLNIDVFPKLKNILR